MLQHQEIEAVYNCQNTNKKVAEVQRLFYLLQVLGGNIRSQAQTNNITILKYLLKITISPCASHKLFNIFMLCDTFTYFYQLKTPDYPPFSLPLLS